MLEGLVEGEESGETADGGDMMISQSDVRC